MVAAGTRAEVSVFEHVAVSFEGDDVGAVDEAVDHGGGELFGQLDWWSGTVPGAGSVLISTLSGKREIPGRPGQRPSNFKDAG